MLSTLRDNRSLTFYQPTVSHFEGIDTSYTGGISSFASASAVMETQMQTSRISAAFNQLKNAVIARGKVYAGNSAASRGGYMAEDFVAESYNLDAVIKRVNVPKAITVKSTAKASPDVQAGDQTASLKYNVDAKSSAKAQLNPAYENQKRIVPKD